MKRTLKHKLLKMKGNKKRKSRKNAKKRGCTRKLRMMRGGNINPASFQPFGNSSGQYYYNPNNYAGDPSDPSIVMSSRNLPSMMGGKKKLRRIRGGEPFMSSVFGSLGNLNGAATGTTVFSGRQLTNDLAIVNNPKYNAHSPPLA